MSNILLFINGKLGLKIVKFLASQTKVQIVGIVVNAPDKRSPNYIPQLMELSPSLQLFVYSEHLWEQADFQDVLGDTNLAVSALFGHLIPSKVIDFFGTNIVNLHPSLLPLGRGADPIAWAIIENNQQGVSIHVLEEKLDSGPIISQSQIATTFGMSAGDIYELAMDELERLFHEFIANWPAQTESEPQKGLSSYHQASELQAIRTELCQSGPDLERSLRVIQALTFADGRAARLRLDNGELWEVSLKLSRIED
jgi:methionyl-tRNA formyltransferase